MRFASSLRLAAFLLASTAFAGAGFAQDAPVQDPPATGEGSGADDQGDRRAADENDSNDIIITATKREENLQDVPISIQALGTERLEELNVASFNDYTKLTPS